MKIIGHSRREIWRWLKIAVVVVVSVFGLSRVLLAWDWFAVKVTLDQSRLARIAMEAGSWDVCRVAVEKLTDQALLAQVVLGASNLGVCNVAVAKLTDQTWLAKVATESKWGDDREVAVKSLLDQPLLAGIAMEDEDEHVRAAAARRLSEQPQLSKVAVDAKDSWVRKIATMSLKDQSLLAKIVVNDISADVREAAAANLTDQALLVRVAGEDESGDVGTTAYHKLRELSSGTVAPSASTGDNAVRLYSAVFRKSREVPIPEEYRGAWFLSIASIVRLLLLPCVADAVGRVETIGIAWEPRSAGYSTGVVQGERITLAVKTDKSAQPLLYTWTTCFYDRIEYRERDEPPKWLGACIKAEAFYSDHLNLPQVTHARIVLESKYPDLRRAAINELEDQALLARIAVAAQDASDRRAVIDKLTDQVVLSEIAADDAVEFVREAAQHRLKELQGYLPQEAILQEGVRETKSRPQDTHP